MQIRLSKYLADAGICARRKAEEEILQGHVAVNGEVVRELGTKADTDNDIVTWRGKVVVRPMRHVYVMLHKPEGYVTTAADEHGRPTVMSLVADAGARLVPIGRLDYNTSGLLLMTNDGDLTYKLTHPKHEIKKTYLAKIKGSPTAAALHRFRSGLEIEDYKTAPADIVVIRQNEKTTDVKIIIGEGRNRQVRKMCEAIGHPVTALKRAGTGRLFLENLPKGQYRHLTQAEVNYLKKL